LIWVAIALGVTFLVYGEGLARGTLGIFVASIALFLGIYLLLKGADYLIEGAVAIAERFGVSRLFIGLSLVAFGTSAPELAVSITAALKGHGGIAISNVVGSNVANILLGLGITALITEVSVSETTFKVEMPFLIIVSVSFVSMLFKSNPPSILWNDGIVLLGFLIIFAYYLFKMAQFDMEVIEKKEDINLKKAIFFTVVGLFGVSVGGDMTVTSIVEVAKKAGLSESLFALTVVAVGTSLPELVTSITAIKKGHHDLSVGNIVGSNVMNILVIIGVSSVVGKKLLVDVTGYYIDASFLIFSVLILWLLSFKGRLKRLDGFLLILLYIPFISYILIRG
jgi:cation:H+ antiporter